MEQFRLFLAILLSFLVFLVWDAFFVDKEALRQQQQPQQEQAQKEPPQKQEPAPAQPASPKPPPPEPTEPRQPPPAEPSGETVTVETPLYTVKLNEKGAAVTSFVLKNYQESAREDAPLKQLVSPDIPVGTVQTGLGARSLGEMETALFKKQTPEDRLQVEKSPRPLVFRWSNGEVVVEKTYRFAPDSYLIRVALSISNQTQSRIRDNLTVSLLGRFDQAESRYSFQGPSALISNGLEQIDIDDIPDQNRYEGAIRWFALERQYFISAVVLPERDLSKQTPLYLSRMAGGGVVKSQYWFPEAIISPGDQQVYEFDIFFGPKSLHTLNELDNGLAQAVDFGWFDIIAKPCLWLMNFIYDFIPNYGVAIIFLTIIIKLLLWPLGNKSYKSMNDMKKLQPEMARIREKYKHDKQKMNQELMALYKTYGINPLGGCLPMVLQIPVFIALYRMLYEAIELRHAPFALWINDLSAPDRLFRFNVDYIPLMEPPYGIPVLTVIMGLSMYLQQKMTPQAGDPTQAKMMTLMPIVLTVIFVNFPAGLVLYFLVNNLLSMAQQYYISKKNA